MQIPQSSGLETCELDYLFFFFHSFFLALFLEITIFFPALFKESTLSTCDFLSNNMMEAISNPPSAAGWAGATSLLHHKAPRSTLRVCVCVCVCVCVGYTGAWLCTCCGPVYLTCVYADSMIGLHSSSRWWRRTHLVSSLTPAFRSVRVFGDWQVSSVKFLLWWAFKFRVHIR